MKNNNGFTEPEMTAIHDIISTFTLSRELRVGQVEGYINQHIVHITKVKEGRYKITVTLDNVITIPKLPRTDFTRTFEVKSVTHFKKLLRKVVRYTKTACDLYYLTKELYWEFRK